MQLRWFLAILILGTLIVSAQADELPTSTAAQAGLSAEMGPEIDAAVNQLVDQHKMSGAVVVVMRGGKVVYYQAYGYQDIEEKTRMKPESIFRIYSMTKLITTVAVMQLWEQGKFQLEDPVSKFLPELKDQQVYDSGEGESLKTVAAQRPLQVVDLIRHTAGITYGNRGTTPADQLFAEANLIRRDRDLKAMITELASLPLKAQPGSEFDYGPSIDVLGRLVEVWSGQPLDEYFAEHIFQPLDMRDTGFQVPADKLERFVTNYRPADGSLVAIERPATSPYREKPALLSGGGGLVSTARDYSRLLAALTGKGKLGNVQLLKADTIALMMKNHVPEPAMPISMGSPRPGVGFGLGFSVRVAADPQLSASPVGECRWGGAASTHFWIWPEQEVAVVALQQQMPYTGLLQDVLQPIIWKGLPK